MHWSDNAFIALKAKGFRYAVRPNRPHFVEECDKDGAIFGANSLQEVFDAPYIKQWKKEAVLVGLETEYYGYSQRLIRACMKDGSHWVIGYFAELQDYKSDGED